MPPEETMDATLEVMEPALVGTLATALVALWATELMLLAWSLESLSLELSLEESLEESLELSLSCARAVKARRQGRRRRRVERERRIVVVR